MKTPYFCEPAECGSGWRIVIASGPTWRKQLVGKSGRPRHFRTHVGAMNACMRLNREYVATKLAEKKAKKK